MFGCCVPVPSGEQTATRGPNPVLLSLPECPMRMHLVAEDGTSFVPGTPVVPDPDNPGHVLPFDPADPSTWAAVIGVVLEAKTTLTADPYIDVISNGRLNWSDIAGGLGESETDQAAWWIYFQALQSANIYLQFN